MSKKCDHSRKSRMWQELLPLLWCSASTFEGFVLFYNSFPGKKSAYPWWCTSSQTLPNTYRDLTKRTQTCRTCNNTHHGGGMRRFQGRGAQRIKLLNVKSRTALSPPSNSALFFDDSTFTELPACTVTRPSPPSFRRGGGAFSRNQT